MNDANNPLDDEAFEELLGPLRKANLPDGVRSANREAVRRALERHSSLPWWRRTVAVPMPLAIAASLTLMVTAAASLWPALDRDTGVDGPEPTREIVVESDTTTPRWSITRSYILSIGSLADVHGVQSTKRN